MEIIRDELMKHKISARIFASDGDLGANQKKKECFEFLMERFLHRDINPYKLLCTNPMLLWISDALHLQKLAKY